MKRCPYCAEEIQDAAIKCRHCGEFLDETARTGHLAKPKVPWYFRAPFIVFMLASVGPFALPLIWWRPGLSGKLKVVFTVGVLLVTWLLVQWLLFSLKVLNETYGEFLQSM